MIEEIKFSSELISRFVQGVQTAEPVSGLTHNYYRYPARFSPRFARETILAFSKPGDLVLDPFMGGGTTLVEAMAAGRYAVGVDISPLGFFVAKAKTSIVDEAGLKSVEEWAQETLLVETDADVEFDRRTLVGIRWDPNDQLELASKSPLRGGRIRWRLRTSSASVPGRKGRVIVTITNLDGSQLSDAIEFEVLPELESPSKEARGPVPAFEIIPINPDDPRWGTVWPDVEETADKIKSVAYRPVTMQDGTIKVYYSTVFSPFESQVDAWKQRAEAVVSLFKTNYEIWIGYHAILQAKADLRTPKGIEEDAYEAQLELERSRVAQVQVRQATRMAELMHRLTREQGETAP
jgi:hypothetical protein